jgi:circadian clock protein KaiB
MADLRLELYVVGRSPSSQAAIENLRAICNGALAGRCDVQIVDVLDHPDAAEAANILATPTLIRRAPLPVRRIIGDLSITRDVLDGLEVDREDPETSEDPTHGGSAA